MPISEKVQNERRRKILDKTREMLAEVGPERLNIRKLASFCGVSVPTLYNQFENKENLVTVAADEIFRFHYENLALPEGGSPLDRILHISDTSAQVFVANPELAKVVMLNLQFQSTSVNVARDMYTRELHTMQASGGLLEWVNVAMLGELLYSRMRNVSAEWTMGRLPTERLTGMRRLEISLCLLGITQGEVHDRLLDIFQQEMKNQEVPT